jgi:transglutaminase-like putative cysteine protease
MKKAKTKETGSSSNSLFLKETPFIDSTNEAVVAFANQHTNPHQNNRQKAIALFYAIRDDFRYDPYQIDLSVQGLKASTTLKNSFGWCVSKAILLTASCRSLGIPAKLGFADVRNHQASAKMIEFLKTDIAYWHGYSLIYLENKWVKATPAFNRALCEKSGWETVEFDGIHDAVFPTQTLDGEPHMEYLNDRGSFTDVPLAHIIKTYGEVYSHIVQAWK